MSDRTEITRLLREAAANEIAAGRHEDRYAAQMTSAGANVYHAFVLALKSAPEYQGRKIDDKAIKRIYESTARRPWWDAALATAKVDGKPATRDWGKRMIQWHLDPSAAQARRAQHALACIASRKKLEKQATSAARGSRESPKQSATRVEDKVDRHAEKITRTAEVVALHGRTLPSVERAQPDPDIVVLEDLLGEVNRISSAVRKVKPSQRLQAQETLRVTARELEELAG